MHSSVPIASGVYLIANKVTGKVYVGSARNMRSRIIAHRQALRAGKHHSQTLQRSWNKHGESAFVASVIETCDAICVREREQSLIDAYCAADSERGYNINPSAASGRCMPHSEETKRKIGAANKGNCGSRGREVTDRQRAALAVNQQAGRRPPLDVMRAAWSASVGNKFHLGCKHDESARAKMSAKTRGEKHPRAVLSESDVAEIRKMRATGMSGPKIAAMFGVHSSSIYCLLNGKSWRHTKAEAA